MSSDNADDGLFDDPDGWRPFYKDDRFEQRVRIAGDAFFAETLVTIRSSPDVVLALVRQPWDWWANGTIISSSRRPDGSLEMDMKPIWWYVVRLSMRILPARPAPDGRGTRLPVIYSGGFEGPGSIDVYADPADPRRSILRGRGTRIRPHVPMLFANATTVAWGHLWTEAGRLPLTRGTGYVGLIRRAEEQAHIAS